MLPQGTIQGRQVHRTRLVFLPVRVHSDDQVLRLEYDLSHAVVLLTGQWLRLSGRAWQDRLAMGPGVIRLLSGHWPPRLAVVNRAAPILTDMSTQGHEVGRKQRVRSHRAARPRMIAV